MCAVDDDGGELTTAPDEDRWLAKGDYLPPIKALLALHGGMEELTFKAMMAGGAMSKAFLEYARKNGGGAPIEALAALDRKTPSHEVYEAFFASDAPSKVELTELECDEELSDFTMAFSNLRFTWMTSAEPTHHSADLSGPCRRPGPLEGLARLRAPNDNRGKHHSA